MDGENKRNILLEVSEVSADEAARAYYDSQLITLPCIIDPDGQAAQKNNAKTIKVNTKSMQCSTLPCYNETMQFYAVYAKI